MVVFYSVVSSANPAWVDLSRDDNSGSGATLGKDTTLLALFNPAKDAAVYDTAGAERSVGSQVVNVPADFSGDEVHAFLGFISEDGGDVSNSVYLGSVNVA